MLGFDVSSTLPRADSDAVWAHAVSWSGVNRELAPIAMSHPPEFPTVASVPPDGRVHFVSVLSVFGVPFDRHHLTLQALDAPRSFHEVSSNLLMRRWEHVRTLEPIDGGVRVTDRCRLEPRAGVPGRMLVAIYRRVFARRHQRLRSIFGTT